jgi:hypothetical protein
MEKNKNKNVKTLNTKRLFVALNILAKLYSNIPCPKEPSEVIYKLLIQFIAPILFTLANAQ